jgi:hypothetical protein
MGPLFVVLSHPVHTDLTHLLQRLDYVGIKHLMPEGPIEPFHKSILIRVSVNFDWRMKTSWLR